MHLPVASPLPGFTVVTVTRDRPELLARAVKSVQAQQPSSLRIEHIIVGDACPSLDAWATTVAPVLAPKGGERPVRCVNCPRSSETAALTASSRCSRLRMRAVKELSSMEWVAFMDDDTVMLPHHLSLLLTCAKVSPAVELVYSHRVLFTPGGALFEGDYFPWGLTEKLRNDGLKVMQRRGILAAGCPVMFDTEQWDTMSNFSGTVDGNEWLMSKSLLQRVPWPEDVSEKDEAHGIFEDGKFLRAVRDADEPIRCSHVASIAFQVGGRSNGPAPKPGHGLLDSLLHPYVVQGALLERLASLRRTGVSELVLLLTPAEARHAEAAHFGAALVAQGFGAGVKGLQKLSGAPSSTLEAVASGAGCLKVGEAEVPSFGEAGMLPSSWLGRVAADLARAEGVEVASLHLAEGAEGASAAEGRRLLVFCVKTGTMHGLARRYLEAFGGAGATSPEAELRMASWPSQAEQQGLGDLEVALLWMESGVDRFFYEGQEGTLMQ